MFTPTLRIPRQKVVSGDYQGIRPDEISVQNWLNKRDHLDHQEFLNTLAKLNRIQCPPGVRMSIMAIMDTEIQKELELLVQQTNSIAFPISEEFHSIINQLQQLLLESSIAYQIIVHDIAQDNNLIDQYLGSLVPESLFMALFYLSRLLVERFQFYLSEPAYIWQELNQLYLLAERIGAQDDVIRKHTSIKNCYLQIAILKIMNPYRFMRLEARKIYHLMADWVEHCDIENYLQHAPEDNFVVELLSDHSPHYYNKKTDSKKSNVEKFEGRVVTTERLQIYLDAHLETVNEEKNHLVLSYQARIYNEMLQRIENEISVHEERSEERSLVGHEIKLVSGLRACHHFIDHRKPFNPQAEIDAQLEQRLEQNQLKDDSDINLVGLLEEAKLLDKKNPMGELQSLNPFSAGASVIGDEWEHIYASSIVNANMNASQEIINQHLKEENWKQKNESIHGMLLVSKNDIDVPIGVGMLVAYRLNVEKAYCLATVKWLRVNPHKGVAIGLQLLAVQSRAIAVKGVKGAGAGGQYQRAFLISENDTKGKGGKLHLIVPSGVYDSGSVLKVWHNEKLNSVTLTNVLMATDSFERVSFKVDTKSK